MICSLTFMAKTPVLSMRSPCWAHMAHKVGSVDFCSLISAVVVGKNNFLPASKVHHCSKPGQNVDIHGILRLLGRFFLRSMESYVAALSSWSIQQNQPNTYANMIFQQLSLWKHVPPPCHFRPPTRESYQTALQHAPLFWQTSLINLPSESFKKKLKNTRAIFATFPTTSTLLMNCIATI